jgi:hypothetical protein
LTPFGVYNYTGILVALISCPDCSKQISDSAPTCPSCGRTMSVSPPAQVEDVNATGILGKPGTGFHAANVGCATLIIGVAVLLVIGLLMGMMAR